MKFTLYLFLAFSFLPRTRASAQTVVQKADSLPPSGWTKLHTGIAQDLGGIFALNRDTLYVTAKDVFRSTNGGMTWDSLTNLPAYGTGYSVYFVSDSIGFLMPGNKGTLFKTFDGGRTWQPRSSGLQSMGPTTFVDRYHGWILGSGEVSRTTDGGETWQQQFIVTLPYAIAFADAQRGVMMGELEFYQGNPNNRRGACIETTADGGKTWNPNVTALEREVLSLAFVRNDTIVAVGNRGLIALSGDWGAHWDSTPSLLTNNVFSSVSFTDSLRGLAVGSQGWIARTSNGGHSWAKEEDGLTSDLSQIQYIDSNTAFVVGEHGTVLKTTSGGVSEVPAPQGQPNNLAVAAYPQPAASFVTLQYALPEPQPVTLSLYDVAGRVVAVPVSGAFQQGNQSIAITTKTLSSGSYTYELTSPLYHAVGNITVVH